jgi:hypothetical protein
MTRQFPAVPVLLLSLVVSLGVTGSAAAKTRAVKPPSPACAFSLSPSFGTTVAAAGLSRAGLSVIASPSTCTSWNAYSLTDWVTVAREGNTVFVDVAPNPTSTPRVATLLVAGHRYEFSQEGAAVVTPPIAGNILANGGFDSGLAPWEFQDRFPNGPGTAAWSSFDANNNPNSGSIRLRNTRPAEGSHTFQQLQCTAVEAGQIYEYGGKFFATSGSAGSAVFGIVEYADDNCDVAAVANETQTPRIRTAATWQSESYTKRMGSTTRSVFVVIGSRATAAGTFEIFMDDVFLRKR